MLKRKNKTNAWAMMEGFERKQEKKQEKLNLKPYVDYKSKGVVDTKFVNGTFDYALLRSDKNTRVMRLFYVASAPNLVRYQQNNEKEFEAILKQFGKKEISFVVMYAHKPGKGLKICYGVSMLVGNSKSQIDYALEETKSYYEALIEKFSAAYQNIEIMEFKRKDAWVFEGFNLYKHLTIARGIPRQDEGAGVRPGSNPYSSPVRMGQQEVEILLKGVSTKRVGGRSVGIPFLMCAIFEKVDTETILGALEEVNEILGRLASSRQLSVGESESFSTPLMFGLGFGDMLGQSQSHSTGDTDSTGATHTVGSTHTDGTTDGITKGHSDGTSDTLTDGKSDGKTHTDGLTESKGNTTTHGENHGSTKGLSYVASYAQNDGQSDQKGSTDTKGDTHSDAKTESQTHSEAKGQTHSNTESDSHSASKSDAKSLSDGTTKTHGTSNTDAKATSASESHSGSLGGGVTNGDGSSVTRMQHDYFMENAIQKYEQYYMRLDRGLRDGMSEYFMFILTPDKNSKTIAEELLKQSYTDSNTPLPIRVQELTKEDEKHLINCAKMASIPDVPETRIAIPDQRRYSTYVLPIEGSAFDLPQTNLPGYMSSHDPVPELRFVGPMDDEEGVELGFQLDPVSNLKSDYWFKLPFKSLGHILMSGGTGKGKTVLSHRLFSELHNKFGMNVIIFDWTKNYRSLIGNVDDPSKFRFGSFDPDFFPMRFNIIQTPDGVPDDVWNGIVSEIICYTMSLGSRSFMVVKDVLDAIKAKIRRAIEEVKAEAATGGYVPTIEHLMKHHTLETLAEGIEAEEARRSEAAAGRMDFNEKGTFSSMKERLKRFKEKDNMVYKSLCGEQPFLTVKDLIDGNFLQLIECANLPADVKQLVITGMTAAILYYCKFKEYKLKKPTYLVYEEAQGVMQQPTGNEPYKPAEMIFEILNREARNYNLYVAYICQSPELVPEKIFDSSPIKITFQIADEEGKSKIISEAGKDPKRMDVDLVKWLSRQPRGTCLIRNSNFDKIQDGELIPVMVEALRTDEIGNEEFKELYLKRHKLVPKTA